MKYKTWSIGQDCIDENRLNEDALREAIGALVGEMKDSPFHCSGMVIAAKFKGGDWRYFGEKYFGEELPSVTDKVPCKESGLIAFVVATVREVEDGTDEDR